jgi:hypothetical protein
MVVWGNGRSLASFRRNSQITTQHPCPVAHIAQPAATGLILQPATVIRNAQLKL